MKKETKKEKVQEEFGKWLWDIAKYVVSAVIISTFLGKFSNNDLLLFGIGFVIAFTLFLTGTYLQLKSKTK
jgi:hypothetical protein